jgi:hypothetical protein
MLQKQYELEEENNRKFQEGKGQKKETQVTQKGGKKAQLKLRKRLDGKSPDSNQG